MAPRVFSYDHILRHAKPNGANRVVLVQMSYYGSKRLMWGSDCAFQVQSEMYADSISLLRDRLDLFSTEDKEWVLRRTAEETFFQ
jgi:predicted TIM-barrel fold metal-dependent hydrolase